MRAERGVICLAAELVMRVTMHESTRGMIPTTAAGGEVDMARLRHALWRRKWGILIPTLLVGIAAGLIVNLLTPKYKSEARVLIENRENIFLRPEAEKSIERVTIDPEAVTSQVQLVLSRE